MLLPILMWNTLVLGLRSYLLLLGMNGEWCSVFRLKLDLGENWIWLFVIEEGKLKVILKIMLSFTICKRYYNRREPK